VSALVLVALLEPALVQALAVPWLAVSARVVLTVVEWVAATILLERERKVLVLQEQQAPRQLYLDLVL
jgi:hypothetical protein